MPWKDGYTVTDERSIEDKDVKWPNGCQCAVSIVVDYSVQAGPDGIGAEDIERHLAEYGKKVEAWKLLDTFEKYGVRATFAVPAIIAEDFTESVREIVERGHEVAAHGYRHEDVSALDMAEEKRRLNLTTQTLEEICGKRPAGWFTLPRQGDRFAGGSLSPNTVDLLIEAGYDYLGNSMADDVPHYWVSDFRTRRYFLALPYHYSFNDLFFLMFPAPGTGSNLENPMTLFQNWKLEFDATYRRGRQFTMVVHPYLIGWGIDLKILEDTLTYIKEFPGIWNPTGNECARYWKDVYPPSSFLNLKESIWKDYSGSLS
jgi:peptidoglycan/xylan/chitin deacetylase (PgdA/CDA1 family)